MNNRPAKYMFFLSYAREDDRDSIRRFFNDLSSEIRSCAGLPPGTVVGFLDIERLELGTVWADELVSALAGTHTFVGLVSPRYVKSRPCGREWAIFADRLKGSRSNGRPPPRALFPLIWQPSESLHPVVAAHHFIYGNAPPAYLQAGLRQFVRQPRHRDVYFALLQDLAQRINRAASLDALPPSPQDIEFGDIPSAFHGPHPVNNA